MEAVNNYGEVHAGARDLSDIVESTVTVESQSIVNHQQHEDAFEESHSDSEENKYDVEKRFSCSLMFTSVETVKAHMRETHVQESSIKEQQTKEIVDEAEKVTFHKSCRSSVVKRVSGTPVKYFRHHYPCPCCERCLVTQRSLGIHITLEHNGEHHFACDTCGKKFLTPLRMNDHARKVHVTSRKFVCIICQKGYKNMHALNRHNKCFHTEERNHLCNICGSLFKMKYSLLGHLRNIHGVGEQTFDCDLCKKVFMSQLNLDRHKKHVHIAGAKIIETCRICQKSFASHHNLRNHMEGVHCTERKFKCSLCEATFKRKHQVNDHRRNVHTNDRRYPCPYESCIKTYKKGSHLKAHIKNTHGEEYSREMINQVFKNYNLQYAIENDTAKVPVDEGVVVSISDHNAVLLSNEEILPTAKSQKLVVLSTNEQSDPVTQKALRVTGKPISVKTDDTQPPSVIYLTAQKTEESNIQEDGESTEAIKCTKQTHSTQSIQFATKQTLVGSNIMVASVVHIEGSK